MISLKNKTHFFEKTYIISLFLTGFFSFFWIQGKNIALITLLIHTLFFLKKDLFINLIKKDLFINLGILIFLLVLVGTLYSPEKFSYAISVGVKYRRFLYPLGLIPLFYLLKNFNHIFLYGSLGGIAFRYLDYFFSRIYGLPDWLKKSSFYNEFGYPTLMGVNPIYTAFMSNLGAYLALYLFKKSEKKRFLIALLPFVFYLIFCNQQKTGFFLFLVWFIPWILLQLNRKSIFFIFIAICPFLWIQIKTPNSALNRTVSDIKEIQKTKTSLGARSDLLKSCFILFKDKPLLGWGTGGISHGFRTHGFTYIEGEKVTGNMRIDPHNQFFLFLVEWGFLGFSLFVFWLGIFFKDFYISSILNAKSWALCLAIFIIAAFFSDVMIFLNLTGDFLIILFCLIRSNIFETKDLKNHEKLV